MSLLAGYMGARDLAIESALLRPLEPRHVGPVHRISNDAGHILWAADAFGAADAERGLARAGEAMLGIASEGTPSPQLLLEAYLARGVAAFQGLRGSYALALLNGPTLVLARDIAGIRSLYVTRHRGRRCFAIEPKALRNLPGFTRAVEPRAVARYFAFSFQPGRETMLRGVEQLPAARIWRYDAADMLHETSSYDHESRAHAPHAPLPATDDTRRIRSFEAALREIIRGRLEAHASRGIAATLSGGLDSSLVASLLAQEHGSVLPTYTLHFGKELPNELTYARQVAEHVGSDHHEVELRPRRFARDLAELVTLLDDPIGDPVTLGNYAMARSIAPAQRVVFNGEGGDPCFGGPKTIPMMMHHWYGAQSGALHRERAYLNSYKRAYHEIPRLLLGPYREAAHELPALLTPFFERRHGVLLRMLLEINQRLKGAHLILPKVERLQRSAGLLPQSPLFDPEMIDASMTLPTRLIVAAGIDKRILRAIAAPHVPAEVIARPKSGMRVPVNYWFRGELRRLAAKLLSPRRLRQAGIFDADRVQEILRYDTLQSGARHGLWIWMLLTFEMWRTSVIEGEHDW